MKSRFIICVLATFAVIGTYAQSDLTDEEREVYDNHRDEMTSKVCLSFTIGADATSLTVGRCLWT